MTDVAVQDERAAAFQQQVAALRAMAGEATTDEEMRAITSRIAELSRRFRIATGIGLPRDPASQARELNPDYVLRPHIEHLSQRIAAAVRDVERGKNRRLVVSMPPRAGKSELVSRQSPLWLLRRHPEWKIVMTSYDGAMTGGWARDIRATIEKNPDLGIALKKDGGAGAQWDTVEGGGMFTTSVRGALTGRGAKVMIVDDPVKDFVEAHSLTMRDSLWNWWLSVVLTRLEPPSLVIVVMTRWHEDDFVGRLLSPTTEGNPAEWEQIVIPAIAGAEDSIQRQPGEPLLSPLIDETVSQALERWNETRVSVGTYTFSAMYQQRPAPAKGAIFDVSWWRYWTTNPDLATADGRVVYLDPSSLAGGRWVDSWDCNFESSDESKGGWVVGQRWVRDLGNRYLIAQQRGQWNFTQTIEAMERWARTDDPNRSPAGALVHERLIEKKANGAAIIQVLRDRISGIKPITPTESKEARARAVTPEIESGNVYLPHPADPGNEWMTDFLSEVRNFPHDVADDQVDSMTQALSNLRSGGRGAATVPGRTDRRVPRNVPAAARSMPGRGSLYPRR
jgi:predicted phage terminase large subunit-like protein